MTKRKALITGITGQDGSYLAELLLDKDYEVHAIVRRAALEDPEHRLSRVRQIDDIKFHSASLESYPSLFNVVQKTKPDEFYHLAAQSFVSYTFEDEFSTLNANINGTHYALSATRECAPGCRFYFAASSEMFGKVKQVPQDENTPFHPRSAYGISKCAGFELTRNYRESYGLHATSGILYNHESPRRGFEFVTRKITSYAARIKLGLATELKLGNLDARRDWGHAKEYVQAMWKMVQQPKPDDYVVATGRTHSVREFCEIAFSRLGLDYKKYVVTDPQFYRASEAEVLQGNAGKAREVLGWEPKIGLVELVTEMVDSDLQRLTRVNAAK
jgi:GDPmannose 4,6-dehydratase